MGQEVIQLNNAVLTAGPATAGDGSAFPTAGSQVPLALQPQTKPYQVSTGPQLANVNNPNAPAVALPGVSAAGPVTQAHTLYLRTQAPFKVFLSYFGSVSAQEIDILGTIIIEADPNHPITAITVIGSGQVEYLACGNI